MDQGAFAASYDDLLREPRTRRLWGDSGYYNVGFWAANPPDLPTACDHMVDQLLLPVADDAAVIVDLGCGLGATTRRIRERFPDTFVVAANLSPWQLLRARERGARAALATDGAELALADGSVDAIVSVEAVQHFPTRRAFLAEALHVLRPGGTLTAADMLFDDGNAMGWEMFPGDNLGWRVEDYERELDALGFVDVEVRDVTDITWRPFLEVFRSGYDPDDPQPGLIGDALAQYVLVTAQRPATPVRDLPTRRRERPAGPARAPRPTTSSSGRERSARWVGRAIRRARAARRSRRR